MKTLRALPATLVTVVGSFALLTGCSVDDTSSTEDLSASGKKLVGAYATTSSVPAGAHIIGLVLSSEKVTSASNRFVADVDTGIKCITTPCPSVVHVTGKFSATTKTLTLTADPNQPDAQLASKVLGKLSYTKSGSKLTLTKTGFKQTLGSTASYCGEDTAEDDCALQGLDDGCGDAGATWTCSSHKCVATCDQGNFCGGFAGIACPGGEFCKHPDGACHAADIGGTCTPIPKCNPNWMDPVCGCDGVTYNNGCMALAANAQVDHAGACN